jgi:hypothetical protein
MTSQKFWTTTKGETVLTYFDLDRNGYRTAKNFYNNFKRITMSKHICQGTKCHTYDTQSRISGTKGNKVLRTRYAYGSSDSWNANRWELYFCDERCMNDWFKRTYSTVYANCWNQY